MRFLPIFCAASVLATGCVHEISVEDRLDRDTQNIGRDKPLPSSSELASTRCDSDVELAKARNVDRPETDRIQSYADLYTGLRNKAQTLQDALSRNPDLSYQADAEKIRAIRDVCQEQTANVKVEFERYVRELVDHPVVQEVRGGRTLNVPRSNFTVLRRAIAALDPEDREALTQRVNASEKRFEAERRR